MRLKVSHARSPRHLDSVTAVGWASGDEIFSCADDHILLKWKLASMDATTVTEMPSPPRYSWRCIRVIQLRWQVKPPRLTAFYHN
ncbi:hypothetical protein COOONC_19752 [Cooperia oncophora]